LGAFCILTSTRRVSFGSTVIFCEKSIYPAWRTITSWSPGSSRSFFDPFSSLMYPTYWPSTQTPELRSTLDAPWKSTCPRIGLCAKRGAAIGLKSQSEKTIAAKLAQSCVSLASLVGIAHSFPRFGNSPPDARTKCEEQARHQSHARIASRISFRQNELAGKASLPTDSRRR
jgi:hypothetical protein